MGINSKESGNEGKLRMRCSIIPTIKRNTGSMARNIPKFLYSLDIYILRNDYPQSGDGKSANVGAGPVPARWPVRATVISQS